jgi:hypothetical protein
MTGTINVPTTLGGSFVYATAAGNITVSTTGWAGAGFALFVDGAAALQSPPTMISTFTPSTANNYTTLSWTADGLWQTLGPGNHTIALYVQNCGVTFTVGRFSGATLTSMVLNK